MVRLLEAMVMTSMQEMEFKSIWLIQEDAIFPLEI